MNNKHNTILDKVISEKNSTTKKTFLKEWTPEIFKAMEKKISKHFSLTGINTKDGNWPMSYYSFNALNELFGLAYTSSSDYAGYWICNTEVKSNKFPSYKYIGFAMGIDRKAYAVLWDKEENEIILPL